MKKKRSSRTTARSAAKDRRSTPTHKNPRRTSGSGGSALWGQILVAALWTLPALFFVPTMRDSFRLPKLVLSETLALLVLFGLTLTLRRVDKVRWRRLGSHPAVLVVSPILLAASASLATSDHRATVVQGLISLWIGGLFVVGLSLGVTSDRLRRSLTWLALPATLLALVAIGQYFELLNLFEFRDPLKDRIRLTSLAGGAFDLAAYLVLPALVAQDQLARARKAGSQRAVWLWGLFLLLCVLTVGLTRTLGAVAALGLGSLVLWSFLVPRRRFYGLAAVVVLVGLGLGLGVEPLRERIRGKLGDVETGNLNRLLTGRLDGWRTAQWMLSEHPLLGVGHGAYRCEFGEAKLTLRAEGVDFYRRQHQPYFVNAHNEALEALAEWGWVGALALLLSLALLARHLARLRRQVVGRKVEDEDGEGGGDAKMAATEAGETAARHDAALIFGGLAALLVMAATNFPLRLALVAYPYLVLLALLWARVADSEDSVDGESADGEPGLAGNVVLVVLAVLLIGALWFRGQEGLERLRANQIVGQVERVTLQLQGSGQLSRGNPAVGRTLEAGIEALRRGRDDDPAEVSLPVAQAALYRLLGRPQAALRAYQDGLAIESRPEIHAHIGHTLWAQGDHEAARESFHRAVLLDPNLAWELRVYLPDLEEAWSRRRDRRQGAKEEKPFFSDSFESGDTTGWSSSSERRATPAPEASETPSSEAQDE